MTLTLHHQTNDQAVRESGRRDERVFRDLGVAALLTAVVLFISAMSLLGVNVSQLRESYARVQSSNAALLELSAVHTDVLQTEMSIRGYLLSGDRDFIGWGMWTRGDIERSLLDLNTLMKDDPVQAAHLARLYAVMKDYQAKFASVTELPHDQAVATVIKLAKSNVRAPIVQILATMQHDEEQRLAERVRTANDNVQNAVWLAFAIIAMAVVAGGLGLAWTVRRAPLAKSN